MQYLFESQPLLLARYAPGKVTTLRTSRWQDRSVETVTKYARTLMNGTPEAPTAITYNLRRTDAPHGCDPPAGQRPPQPPWTGLTV